MPDGGWGEDDIKARRPAKADYVLSRQFKEPMSLPCRLWLAGHRGYVPRSVWQGFVKGTENG